MHPGAGLAERLLEIPAPAQPGAGSHRPAESVRRCRVSLAGLDDPARGVLGSAGIVDQVKDRLLHPGAWRQPHRMTRQEWCATIPGVRVAAACRGTVTWTRGAR